MEELGVVTKVEDMYATVVVARKSGCDQCSMGCKMTTDGAEIEALNLVRAKVGQTVKVQIRAATYLKGSLLIYGLPALFLVIGAVLGREVVARLIQAVDKDLVSAICGFGAFALAFVLVRLISSRMEKSTQYKPVIEEIVYSE